MYTDFLERTEGGGGGRHRSLPREEKGVRKGEEKEQLLGQAKPRRLPQLMKAS